MEKGAGVDAEEAGELETVGKDNDDDENKLDKKEEKDKKDKKKEEGDGEEEKEGAEEEEQKEGKRQEEEEGEGPINDETEEYEDNTGFKPHGPEEVRGGCHSFLLFVIMLRRVT
jgi:hypothetical protein